MMRIKWKLTVASLKMYLRQKEAIIWNILFPFFMVLLFSFVRFGGVGGIGLGLVNQAGERASTLVRTLKQVTSLRVLEGGKELELAQLEKGERDLVLIIPDSYDPRVGGSMPVYVNDARPQEVELGMLVLQRVMDELTFSHNPALKAGAGRTQLEARHVHSRNLTYIDFLLPGVLAMSIMQMGIFGVAFGFVSLKKRGILRRLWVTPINPNDFIFAQVATRLLVVAIQMTIMVAAGVLLFDLHFVGGVGELFVVGILGAVVFLGIGFAIAGVSKSEDQVAPIANVINLPMMLLSGVFFSRANLPGFVHVITDYFPLTYLADGLRSVAIDGASLGQVGPQLMGLSVWSVLSCVVAVRLFRWE
jgi:ABC-2 type transport system permease protein